MSGRRVTVTAADEEAMVAFGARLAAAARSGLVIYLCGELGMGKTTLSRGFIQAMGHRGAVKSPTYTLVEPYQFGSLVVYHFDLYRLGDPLELEYMGIRDYFDGESICLVEWPGRGEGVLPPADIVINIERGDPGRRMVVEADTVEGVAVLQRLEAS